MPELPTPEDVQQDIARDDSLSSLTNVQHTSFTPADLPISLEKEPEGSLFLANLRRETTIGGMLYGRPARTYSEEELDGFNFIEHIPQDLLDYAPSFANDATEEQITETADVIRAELKDKSLMAAHPWKSFASGFGAQMLDPANLLPGGAIYKNAKRGTKLARAAGASVASGVASAGIQEGILQQTQLTREGEEAAWNMVASGVFSAAIGSAVHVYSGAKRTAAIKEIENVYTDTPKVMGENGLLNANDLANMPESAKKLMFIGPMNQLFNSKLDTAKAFGRVAYQNSFEFNDNLSGVASASSIERSIVTSNRKFGKVSLDYNDHYFAMNDINKGPFRGTRDFLSTKVMNRKQFDDAVSLALTQDVTHANPHVDAAASLLRNEVFDPIFNDLVKFGELPAGITVKNAPGYFMTVWNKQLIKEQGGRNGILATKMYDSYSATRERIKQFTQSKVYKDSQIELKKNKAEAKRLKAKESTPAIKQKLKKIKEQNKKLEAEVQLRASKIDPAMINSKGKLRSVLSDNVLRANAEQTIDNIIGHQDGVLLNPVLSQGADGGAKPLHARTFLGDQIDFREWQVTDGLKVAELYHRGLTPIIEINRAARAAGFDSVKEWKAGIEASLKSDFHAQSKDLKGKAFSDAEKAFKNDVSNINDTFKLLQGIYGSGPNVLDNSAANFFRNVLTWNASRLLGFMTLSSIPDVGLQVFRNGMYKSIHEGLSPMLRNSDLRKMRKSDLRHLGYAIETQLGTRWKAMAEHQGLSTQKGVFSKGLDVVSQKLGNFSLMNQWNDLMQEMAGSVSIGRTLDSIHAVVRGEKISAKDSKRLASLGLDRKYFGVIAEQTKSNIDKPTGSRYAGWDKWNVDTEISADALRVFQNSVGQDIDGIVIVPGLGDKPLVGHTMLGKVLLQFKTFLMSATNKVMFSGIQRRADLEVYTGLVSMLSLGAMSYIATQVVRGNEDIDYSFANLSQEAIDRSGVLGIFMEGWNIGSKALIPQLGASRYQSRSLMGALLGPFGGAVDETAGMLNRLIGAAGGTDLTTKDAEKLLRLMPYQNLFYLYQLDRKITKDLAISAGFKEV
jgi:hypothetical protein